MHSRISITAAAHGSISLLGYHNPSHAGFSFGEKCKSPYLIDVGFFVCTVCGTLIAMKAKKKNGAIDHTGSTFDSFLEEEGIREEVEAVAVKRVIAWQLAEAMRKKKKTKQALAKELNTSRSQLDRLLDPQNIAVSLDAITRAARVLGKRIIIRIADAKVG